MDRHQPAGVRSQGGAVALRAGHGLCNGPRASGGLQHFRGGGETLHPGQGPRSAPEGGAAGPRGRHDSRCGGGICSPWTRRCRACHRSCRSPGRFGWGRAVPLISQQPRPQRVGPHSHDAPRKPKGRGARGKGRRVQRVGGRGDRERPPSRLPRRPGARADIQAGICAWSSALPGDSDCCAARRHSLGRRLHRFCSPEECRRAAPLSARACGHHARGPG
mmetsp:Transcript_27017/g.86817  ORF Transcript_27017/g.86817 Transcript_27017/m.86817 type:complete len:219 (-) Transcript_27017:501-1157(-)